MREEEVLVCLPVCVVPTGSLSLRVCFNLFYYGRKHRTFEALTAGLVIGHPLASASCVIVTTVNTTTPSNPSAATTAITPNDVILLLLLFILSSSPSHGSIYPLKR